MLSSSSVVSSWSKLVVAVAWVLAWSSFTVRAQGQGMGQVPPLPAVEMEALQDLYEATSGPHWAMFGVPWNFTGVHNPCEEGWEGVVCTCQGMDIGEALSYKSFGYDSYYYFKHSHNYLDDGGALGAPCHVMELALGYTRLRGTLPSSLASLSFLLSVFMGNNHLRGTIPSSIGSLMNLQTLVLIGNSLTGTIPSSLGYLTGMQDLELDLRSNSLTGSIPTSLGYLIAMYYLDLSSNSLTGSIPMSLGYVTGMKVLIMESNSLTGRIPTELGYLGELTELWLSTNSLTGSIPTWLGYFTAMDDLELYANLLTGSIPTSLGYLTAMSYLDIDTNSLTGWIPTELGYLTGIFGLDLYQNHLTGPIPTSLGYLTGMAFVDLDTNSLTGSIPTSLGYLEELQSLAFDTNSLTGSIPTSLGLTGISDLHLDTNSLTGSIPTSLGYLTGIVDLLLQTNSLSGSIPTSLGYLTAMLDLDLHHNSLTGSIPTSLASCTNLLILLLNDNSLSGNIVDVIKPQLQSMLIVIDLSTNQLTGTIPTALFQVSALKVLALVQNCFSGSLSAEICSAKSLSVLALDGLHTAPSCQGRFFPHSREFKTYELPPIKAMQGTIPSCLFSMPNLTTLHLSGNGFWGSIDGVLTENAILDSVLVDLNLAHNILTGSIPHWIQGRQWSSLDLGYNRLSGTLASCLGSESTNNSILALSVNRLSGPIPSSLKRAAHITILGGNLFGCGIGIRDASLPSNDPGRDSYQCGSNSVDASLAAWAVTLCCWIVLLILVSKHGREVTLLSKLYWFGTVASSHINAAVEAFNFLSREQEVRAAILSICKAASPLNLIRIIASAIGGSWFVVLMSSYGTLSAYYRTHSYVYTWAVSSSYLSGSVAAGVVIALWTIMCDVMFVATVNAIEIEVTSLHRESKISEQHFTWSSRVADVAFLASFVAMNVVVIGGANAAYVLVVGSGSPPPAVVIRVLGITLGAIKAGWNSFVLPITFKHVMKMTASSSILGAADVHGEDDKGRLLLHGLVVLNNILSPCIVEALVDPNCFNYVIEQAPPINVSYAYSNCIQSQVTLHGVICFFALSGVQSASYLPPFIYNYRCTSALLTNYASVYVYSIIFSTFLVPIVSRLWSGANDEVTLDNDKVTTRLMNLFAIAVTFGVAFPLLLIVVLVAVFVETIFAEAQMAKIVDMGGDEAETRERKAAMEAAEEGVMRSLASSLWLLVPLSASFNAFFVFDILGDEVGWRLALGGLFAVIALPMLLWGCYKAWYLWGRRGELRPGASSEGRDMIWEGAGDVEMVDTFNGTFRQSEQEREMSRVEDTTNPMVVLADRAAILHGVVDPTPHTSDPAPEAL